MQYALVYLPPDQVVSFYNEELMPHISDLMTTEESWSDYEEELEHFGDYYGCTWNVKSGGRLPMFPI